MKPIRTALLLAATALGASIAAAPAQAATTVPFTFSASAAGGLAGASGSGSFTTPTATGSFGLADLTAFSLTGNAGALFFVGSYSFGLADLSSFSTTLSNGLVSSLAFQTVSKDFGLFLFGIIPVGTTDIAFTTNGTGAGNLTVSNAITGDVTGDLVVATAAVPEPATWAMMIGGIGFAGAALRRRRATVRTTIRYA